MSFLWGGPIGARDAARKPVAAIINVRCKPHNLSTFRNLARWDDGLHGTSKAVESFPNSLVMSRS